MYWLHSECGYTFVGDGSIAALTYPEMRILYAGYRATERAQEDQQKGVKPQHRQNLSDFDQKLDQGDFDANGASP